MPSASPTVEVPSSPSAAAARGFAWLVASLCFAILGNLLLLGVLVYERSHGPDFGLTLDVLTGWEVVLAAGAVVAILGFRALRRGRYGLRPDHTAEVKQGTMAFLATVVAGAAYVITGLILGFVYVPSGAYVSTSGSLAPWPIWLGNTIRGAHEVAPVLLAVSLGIFLLRATWHLSSRFPRAMAAAAFAAGLVAAFLGASSPFITLPPVLPADPILIGAVSAASLALWALVCFLARLRLLGSTPSLRHTAAAT